MTTTVLLWVIAISGLGTVLIRTLPMIWQGKSPGERHGRGLRKALNAVGPAAITALLLVSIWDMVTPGNAIETGLPALAGLMGVALGSKYLRSIAWATIAGVLSYGGALVLLASL